MISLSTSVLQWSRHKQNVLWFHWALQNNGIIGSSAFSYMFVSTDAKCSVISKLLPPVHPLVPFSRSPGSVPAQRQGLSGPLFLHNDSPPPQSHFSSLTFVWRSDGNWSWSVFRGCRNEVILKQGVDFKWGHLASWEKQLQRNDLK